MKFDQNLVVNAFAWSILGNIQREKWEKGEFPKTHFPENNKFSLIG